MNKISKPTLFYDLATEAAEALRGDKNREISGVSETVRQGQHYSVSHIKISNDAGAEKLMRPRGNYITLQTETACGDYTDKTVIIRELAEIIKGLMPKKKDFSVLICGIGNPLLSADALGAETVGYSFPTRHLPKEGAALKKTDFRSIALLAPNVLGNTGIETAELVESTVQTLKSDIVIVIDALATTSLNRLGTSFQCTDTGIFPGGGVHNHRKEISRNTLRVPVIAIGVPTVIHPYAIVKEAFHLITEKAEKNKTAVTSPWGEMTAEELYLQTAPNLADLAVTPKDIDFNIKEAAKIIAAALAIALHPEITVNNYREYLSY